MKDTLCLLHRTVCSPKRCDLSLWLMDYKVVFQWCPRNKLLVYKNQLTEKGIISCFDWLDAHVHLFIYHNLSHLLQCSLEVCEKLFLFFWDKGLLLYSPDYPWTHFLTQADLQLTTIILLLPLEYWVDKHMPPDLFEMIYSLIIKVIQSTNPLRNLQKATTDAVNAVMRSPGPRLDPLEYSDFSLSYIVYMCVFLCVYMCVGVYMRALLVNVSCM